MTRFLAAPLTLLRSLLRALAAPVRGYFNGHFEMTKEEIRRVGERGDGTAGSAATDAAVRELGDLVSETQLYQTRTITQLRAEVAELRHEVARLTDEVGRLTPVVASMAVRSVDDRCAAGNADAVE